MFFFLSLIHSLSLVLKSQYSLIDTLWLFPPLSLPRGGSAPLSVMTRVALFMLHWQNIRGQRTPSATPPFNQC